jgi:fructokinase
MAAEGVVSARIVGLGELLWDMLPAGPRLGGAPANFAVGCARLGARSAMASAVGRDPLGKQALQLLRQAGVETSAIEENSLPTSVVTVTLDAAGHAAYSIEQPVAWDALEWNSAWRALAAEADAVCFGTLAQRSAESRDAVREFVKHTREKCVRVFDVNLRSPHWDAETLRWGLEHATLLKLNEDELPVLLKAAEITQADGSNERAGAKALLEYGVGLRMVCVTLGGRGSVLVTEKDTVIHPGFPCTVADTVGAGDAFTAAMVTYWLRDAPLKGVAAAANRLGCYVASQPGAMPEFDSGLREQLDELAGTKK